MNQYAANAFLKTLEEPPKDSLIILISSKPDLLPGTIRSRCSRIHFSPLSEEACKKVIQKSLGQELTELSPADDAQLDALIRLCMGRPGSAVEGDLIEERDWCVATLKGMLEAERDGWASREEMIRWFDIMLILLRDMAVLRVTEDEAYLLNNDQQEQMKEISRATDLKGIIEIYQKLNAIKSYLFFNLNKSLTWNYTGSLMRKMMG
jgi:DNA polymerase-3 subunit delta'